jgi:hypothetical protein
MATRVSYRVQKGKSRHVMQAHSTKPGHAVQTTVSTSKILKRPPRKEVYGRKAAHHQRHVYEEHVLFSDWRGMASLATSMLCRPHKGLLISITP